MNEKDYAININIVDEGVKQLIINASDNPVTSLEDYIQRMRGFLKYKGKANLNKLPLLWFRGECVTDEYIKKVKGEGEFLKCYEPLLPKLYRKNGKDNGIYNENKLLQHFRMKAPVFSSELVPKRDETDKWLFLAQHVGLPTRLLDWTESAMVALYFALSAKNAVSRFVWVLDPIGLNTDVAKMESVLLNTTEFPLTWHGPEQAYGVKDIGEWSYDNQGAFRFKPDEKNTKNIKTSRVGEWKPDEKGDIYFYPAADINIGNINIRGAWEKDGPGTEYPVAILPTNIHPRMSVQRSCFTIHGKKKESLAALALEKFPEHLKCYMLSGNDEDIMLMSKDLEMLGITHSALFPDLDGLAVEMQNMDYYKQP